MTFPLQSLANFSKRFSLLILMSDNKNLQDRIKYTLIQICEIHEKTTAIKS